MCKYSEALNLITTDDKFASYQNFDPDLLKNLDYFAYLPADVVKFCYARTDEGTEPYFEEVVAFVKTRIYEEMQKAIPSNSTTKNEFMKV